MTADNRGIRTAADRERSRVPQARPPRQWAPMGQVRDLLARAGLRPGHRILDLGAQLYDRELSAQDLLKFRVLGLNEDVTGQIAPQLWPVDDTASFRFTVRDVNELELPGASFDAVVAIDWWPSTSLAAAASRWRRLVEPEGGAVIVVGTDIRTAASPRGTSRKLIDELTAVGFRLETARDTRTAPEQYAELVDHVRLASERLRKVIGTPFADSYLTHAELLDRAARDGLTHRFQIVARL